MLFILHLTNTAEMRFIWLFCFFSFSGSFIAQTFSLSGKIISEKGDSIPFVNIIDLKTKNGTSSNIDGAFSILVNKGEVILRVSAIGFEQKVLELNITDNQVIDIEIKEDDGVLDEIVISGTLNEISKKESPIPIEVYSAKYLRKVPVPGILAATQNVNGVRPQLNCAVCNTGDIHINGMEGPYTMVTIDGMPIVGGLSTVYGLQGIPSSLLDRLEVIKGPASTLYGSEAVAGLVNVVTKNVNSAPKFAAEFMASSWQEYQADFMFKYAENKKISGIFAADYHNYTNPIDKSGDNFTDLTLKDRISVFNKLEFKRKFRRVATLTTRYLYEDRWGGEMQWTPEFRGGDSIYGESIYTNRAEVIGVYQLPFKEKIMFSSSYSYTSQDSRYGDVVYIGDQHIGYSQLVWHKDIKERHKIVTGLALRYNNYDDNTTATFLDLNGENINNPDIWFLPGCFIQDNIKLNNKSYLLLGSRYDYHTKHGNIFSPRVNYKLDPNKNTSFRVGYGNGFRVVNVFTEDHAALNGSKEVVFIEDLDPERSHNLNFNVEKRINSNWSFISLDASLFYTHFSNKITPDYETNDQQIIYSNLDGYAISRGASLNTKFIFEFPLRINLGVTIMDVFNMEKNESGLLERSDQLFTEPYSAIWSASYYFTRPSFSIDYTGNLYGPMKLPLLSNDFRSEFSKPFSIQNVKISKEFKNGFNFYFGIRNILNFTPPAYSILRSHDPFDKLVNDPIDNPNNYSFDPTYIYTSFQGITFFAGLKYVIK